MEELLMKSGDIDTPFSPIVYEDFKRDRKLIPFDKHSKYLIKIISQGAPDTKLFEYAESFYEAAHRITDFIVHEKRPDIEKLDTFFFTIAFLYRHCIELGLKAIGFRDLYSEEERKQFINDTRHDLSALLDRLRNICCQLPDDKELDWLEKLFADISIVDKESDSFRYPFHIMWGKDKLGNDCYMIKKVFNNQIEIDLVKFVNKFDAAFEIIHNWFDSSDTKSLEWENLKPVFIETGDYYCVRSVVGHPFLIDNYYPYTSSYLRCANFLKWFCKKKADEGNLQYSNSLFLPMCYLYRNCVELCLKAMLFENPAEDFQKKFELMQDYKHSVHGLWKNVKPYALEALTDDEDQELLSVVDNYCDQIQAIDSDASKFRYPMTKNMQPYFSRNTRFDFVQVGDFFEELISILVCIDTKLVLFNEYIADM